MPLHLLYPTLLHLFAAVAIQYPLESSLHPAAHNECPISSPSFLQSLRAIASQQLNLYQPSLSMVARICR